MINFNLFEKKKPSTSDNITYETILKRVFILFFTFSAITAAFYITVMQQNQLITVPSPSISVYQQLDTVHSQTLQCPCSHISVPYGSFINLSVVLHQVCSSGWISPAWLDYVTSFDPTLVPSWTEQLFSRDFRTIGASYFQLLATFCSLVQITVDDAQRIFANTQFVNDRILPPPVFFQQTEDIVDSFIKTTSADFNSIVDWIVVLVTDNYLTGPHINVGITIDGMGQVKMDESEFLVAVEINHDGIDLSGTCKCSQIGSLCSMLSIIYTNGTTLSEFEQVFYELCIGCTPLRGFLFSETQWWYNSTYLTNIHQTYAIVTGLQTAPMITHLKALVPTRFHDISMGELIREMFIEEWINKNASFEHFYAACAPVSCSYTIVQRRSTLVIMLLLISVCSGLNQGLRLLVPLLGKTVVWTHDRWKNPKAAHSGEYLPHFDRLY